ncbi:uncharacterized protein LOC143276447 isoform X2 [Babylonia areolata]
MKFVIVVALIGFAAAQLSHHDHDHNLENALNNLVHQEVLSILTTNPHLSAQQCTTKCDNLFTLVVDKDEATTDDLCGDECLYHVNLIQSGQPLDSHVHQG